MTPSRIAALFCLLAVAPTGAVGQAPDPSAERARLGNQRIQAEVERRAREETAAPAPVGSVTTATPAPLSPAPPAPDGTSQALEQLRQLGQLKDAGYLTDDEFQRIKARILQQAF